MSLLNARHRDPESAALSVAANRAGKCAKLRAEGHADMADRYTESLFYDVREWVASTVAGTNASDQTCSLLHMSVMRARGVPDEWVAYAMQYGAAEAIERAREVGGFVA